MEAILRGDVEHALHPGGGLHHAMPAKAWGFCIYNDPALAIVRARAAGLRVLYVDLDTHHGDGVEAVFVADPGVLTLSLHESGRYLFPGTGFIDDLGEGAAAGTRGQRAARAVHGGDGVAGRRACRWCRRWRRRSGPTSSSRSTARTRTPGTRSRTCG